MRAALFATQNCFWGAASLLDRRLSIEKSQNEFLICAVVRVKDEARFLPEWLTYHRTLGFEHFFIYDNGSSDGLAKAVAPFVTAGYATVIDWPQRPASPACYVHFLRNFGHQSKWVAFFDVDEFLVESSEGALQSVLRQAKDAPAIAVNWRYFGGSGHEEVPRGLVLQRFNRMSAELDEHVKVIAKPSMIYRFRNSHNFYYRRGRLARAADGRRVFGSFLCPSSTPELVLHHYVYRSRADYLRKSRAGFVDDRGGVDRGRAVERAEAESAKHNDVEWHLASRKKEEVVRELRAMGYSDDLFKVG